jgi:hypothetical protein
MDHDKDGRISLEEHQESAFQWAEDSNTFADKDGDGFVDKDEFRVYRENFGELWHAEL